MTTTYETTLAHCRHMSAKHNMPSPEQLKKARPTETFIDPETRAQARRIFGTKNPYALRIFAKAERTNRR